MSRRFAFQSHSLRSFTSASPPVHRSLDTREQPQRNKRADADDDKTPDTDRQNQMDESDDDQRQHKAQQQSHLLSRLTALALCEARRLSGCHLQGAASHAICRTLERPERGARSASARPRHGAARLGTLRWLYSHGLKPIVFGSASAVSTIRLTGMNLGRQAGNKNAPPTRRWSRRHLEVPVEAEQEAAALLETRAGEAAVEV